MKEILIGIFIPFLGTSLGAAMVYLFRSKLSENLEKAFGGFAAGVMIAASVWSLLIPAIEMEEAAGRNGSVAASIGFLLGIVFLLILDVLIPHIHALTGVKEGLHSKFHKTTMMVLAITLHNIPEGMAVGIVFAGLLSNNSLITVSGAFVLSIGIAIQNFPEGAIVSLPLIGHKVNKHKAFGLGVLSGIVEPIAALLTLLLTSYVLEIMPYLLSFAAGAMIYVVAEELIPDSQRGKHSNIGVISLALGFTLMMVLDVSLG